MFLPSETAASSEWRVASSERRITVGDWCLMPHSALSTPPPILAHRGFALPKKFRDWEGEVTAERKTA